MPAVLAAARRRWFSQL